MNAATLAVVFLGMAIGSLALNASVNSNMNAAIAEIRAETQALRESLDACLDGIEVERARMNGELNVLIDAGIPVGAPDAR